MRRLGLVILVSAGLSAACGDDGPAGSAPEPTSPATTTTESDPENPEDAPEPGPAEIDGSAANGTVPRWPVPLVDLDPAAPASWTVEVLATALHDPDAFTQGLELLPDGRLLESTGLRGESEVRIVDPNTGAVEASAALEPEQFGEGLTVVDDTVVQLTWQEQVARRWSLPDLEPLPSFEYAGEGWGVCRLGDRLAMSDGTSVLQWRDATTFELLETVSVTRGGASVDQLNELECVDDHVVANIWRSPELMVISPTGPVVATINAGNLVAAIDSADPLREVLNGVAAHPDGTFSMTGKLWPTRFLVQVIER